MSKMVLSVFTYQSHKRTNYNIILIIITARIIPDEKIIPYVKDGFAYLKSPETGQLTGGALS
jgi:hypothetical protein